MTRSLHPKARASCAHLLPCRRAFLQDKEKVSKRQSTCLQRVGQLLDKQLLLLLPRWAQFRPILLKPFGMLLEQVRKSIADASLKDGLQDPPPLCQGHGVVRRWRLEEG